MPAPTSGADVLAVALDLAALDDTSGPVAGPGSLSINEEAVHGYDYAVIDGPLTVDAFDVADFFTATEDSRSAWVVVKGDLTIDAGQVFTPAQRKLFTVIYVDGDLTLNGEISMTARGANHSASGSDLAAADIRIYQGTIDGVENPQVPASGADGGDGYVATVTGNYEGNDGSTGSDGGTGGGASGGLRKFNDTGTTTMGAGSEGTAFSGGAAAGAGHGGSGSFSVDPAESDGGAGSDGALNGGGSLGAGGGAGNPGGAGVNQGDPSTIGIDGEDGTGGTIIVIVRGELLGTGTISANGTDGGDGTASGGGSGAGSINVVAGVDNSTLTIVANGGSGGQSTGDLRDGGDGGNGTVRVLEGLEIPIQPPTNLQATAVGTDQIDVTWDAVDGADGYEIEIDSGSPVDVGNVLLHEDTGLDPGTTRSYRVRAYQGSPQEFSDWAGPVEAATRSDIRLVALEFFSWQERVLAFASNPPATPDKGDRYIIEATATGAWAGNEDSIAWWDGTAWRVDGPFNGWVAYNLDDKTFYLHHDGWVSVVVMGNGGGLVVTSPDGSEVRLIGIDNSGNVEARTL